MTNLLDPRISTRLRALPMRTVEDVKRHFSGIPLDVEVQDDHLNMLRLLTTSTCRMRCQYPESDGAMWCHDEGMTRNSLPPADLKTMLKVVRYFRDTHGVRQVNLAGLQPKLDDELVEFVRTLRQEEEMEGVAFTSHGLRLLDWLPRLVDAGLTSLQLSVQGFSRKTYHKVMGLDELDNALRVVDMARDLKLPTAVNRVLLKGSEDDIPEVLDWIKTRDLRVRLYDVMWKPGQDKHFLDFHVSWQSLTHLWAAETDRITVWKYGQPGRLNLVFWLKGGGSIETNISVPWEIHTAPVCQDCNVKDACVEGWLGCGIRVTPDAQVQPCLWRPDLNVSALPLLDGHGHEEAEAIRRLLAGDLSTQASIPVAPLHE